MTLLFFRFWERMHLCVTVQKTVKISGVFSASAVALLIGIDGTFMQDLTSASPRMKAQAWKNRQNCKNH